MTIKFGKIGVGGQHENLESMSGRHHPLRIFCLVRAVLIAARPEPVKMENPNPDVSPARDLWSPRICTWDEDRL
jgi:hypothetical protein